MARSARWRGTARIKGPTQTVRMMLLTLVLVGLQFTWGIEMTYFTPYLLGLGLAKSQTSLVWIAPPLSGLIMQPVIGSITDSSTLRWGRRRPYILLCSALVAAGLCTLAWAPDIVGFLPHNEGQTATMTRTLAIVCIYFVDFAVNGVQAAARSLIVDTLPESEQQLGSAWAGRMLGLGHILAYFAGTVDLINVFGHGLGDSQLKQICVIASMAIVSCSLITCFCVGERVLLSERIKASRSCIMEITRVVKMALHLPSRLQAVCRITFWSWIGWSPFFVYGTTWVGETYYRQNATTAEEINKSNDAVGDIARKGSLAFVLFSVLSLGGSVVLPFLVQSPPKSAEPSSTNLPHGSSRIRRFLRKYQMDLVTAWALSQLGVGCCLVVAPLSKSFEFSTMVIALCGIAWAMYGWAPLAIIGAEVSRMETAMDGEGDRLVTQGDSCEFADMSINNTSTRNLEDENLSASAGTYLGIWNIAATVPQFVATFLAMIVFATLEPGKSPEMGGVSSGQDNGSPRVSSSSLNGTAVCLAIGGVCSFVAAIETFRLRRA